MYINIFHVSFQQMSIENFIYKDHIPIDDLGITAKEHDKQKFTIWYKKRTLKSYKLETRDSSIRNSWVDEITSLLWKQAKKKKGENVFLLCLLLICECFLTTSVAHRTAGAG